MSKFSLVPKEVSDALKDENHNVNSASGVTGKSSVGKFSVAALMSTIVKQDGKDVARTHVKAEDIPVFDRFSVKKFSIEAFDAVKAVEAKGDKKAVDAKLEYTRVAATLQLKEGKSVATAELARTSSTKDYKVSFDKFEFAAEHSVKNVGVFTAKLTTDQDPEEDSAKFEATANSAFGNFFYGGKVELGKVELGPKKEADAPPADSKPAAPGLFPDVTGYGIAAGHTTDDVKASISYAFVAAKYNKKTQEDDVATNTVTAAYYQKVNAEVTVAAQAALPGGKNSGITGAVEYNATSNTTYKVKANLPFPTPKKKPEAPSTLPVKVSVNHKLAPAATFKFGAAFDAINPSGVNYTAGITYLA